MTNPTITAGWGFMTDAEATTQKAYGAAGSYAWTETEVGLAASIASNGDIFTITGTCDNAADEYAVYYYPDIAHGAGESNLGISGTAFPKCFVRWKTSASSNGVGIRICVVYSDASTEYIVGPTVPVFSTSYTVTAVTLTAGKTIDHIAVYVDDYPNTINSGTFYVYIDYILFCAQQWTFPSVAPGGIKIIRTPHHVDIAIPGRMTDITQHLGEGNIEIELTGEYHESEVWNPGGAPNVDGETMNYLIQEADDNPWQYFTSDHYKGKVTLREFDDAQVSEGASLGPWRLLLKEFRLLSPSSETHLERFGLT